MNESEESDADPVAAETRPPCKGCGVRPRVESECYCRACRHLILADLAARRYLTRVPRLGPPGPAQRWQEGSGAFDDAVRINEEQ
jgi:hypothetical protein